MRASRSVPTRELHHVDEPRALVVGVVRQRELDVEAGEQLGVAIGDLAAGLEDAVEPLELPDSERRRDVVEPVVEAEPAVLEPAAAVEPALVAKRDEQLVLLGRPGRDRAALARRDLLVRVEGPGREMAVRAERLALVPGAERLARVLDEREPVPVADRAQLVELARVAEDVDGDDGLRPRRDRGLDRRRSRGSACPGRCRRTPGRRPCRSRSSRTRRTSTAR